MGSEYLLRYHEFYAGRIALLKKQVIDLKARLPHEEFITHEVVKIAARIRDADQNIIPQNPDLPEYKLHAELRKYRRYKRGLQRYRIMFCFSNEPRLIVYLYINDEKHLRKAGDKNDPYEEFKKLVKRQHFSHDPRDPNLQKWIQSFSWN